MAAPSSSLAGAPPHAAITAAEVLLPPPAPLWSPPNPNQAHLQVDLAFLMLLHHSQAAGMASNRQIELPSTSSVPTRVKDLGLKFKQVQGVFCNVIDS